MPADGAAADRARSFARPVSPSTSALRKLTEPDEEPLTDPRLASSAAPARAKQNGAPPATKQKKTPTWYRRVPAPRTQAYARQQIKVLELQLEIAKEKNKGR